MSKAFCPNCMNFFNAQTEWREEGEPDEFEMDCPHCRTSLSIQACVTVEFDAELASDIEDDEDGPIVESIWDRD
jgi:hypothetical protein